MSESNCFTAFSEATVQVKGAKVPQVKSYRRETKVDLETYQELPGGTFTPLYQLLQEIVDEHKDVRFLSDDTNIILFDELDNWQDRIGLAEAWFRDDLKQINHYIEKTLQKE